MSTVTVKIERSVISFNWLRKVDGKLYRFITYLALLSLNTFLSQFKCGKGIYCDIPTLWEYEINKVCMYHYEFINRYTKKVFALYFKYSIIQIFKVSLWNEMDKPQISDSMWRDGTVEDKYRLWEHFQSQTNLSYESLTFESHSNPILSLWIPSKSFKHWSNSYVLL